MLFVFNSFMKNLSVTKSKDLMSKIFSGQTSRLYNNIGTHLLYNSCKMTSSETILLLRWDKGLLSYVAFLYC